MLVSAKEMLEKARDGKYAVGQFNIFFSAPSPSILLPAGDFTSPVFLAVSDVAGMSMPRFKTVAAMVQALIE